MSLAAGLFALEAIEEAIDAVWATLDPGPGARYFGQAFRFQSLVQGVPFVFQAVILASGLWRLRGWAWWFASVHDAFVILVLCVSVAFGDYLGLSFILTALVSVASLILLATQNSRIGFGANRILPPGMLGGLIYMAALMVTITAVIIVSNHLMVDDPWS